MTFQQGLAEVNGSVFGNEMRIYWNMEAMKSRHTALTLAPERQSVATSYR
jgi:hypothetical protein